MLADQLSANLPDFQVRKIVQLLADWEVRLFIAYKLSPTYFLLSISTY